MVLGKGFLTSKRLANPRTKPFGHLVLFETMIPGNQACQSRTPPVPHLLTRRGGGVKGSPFFDTKRLKNYLIARTILFRFFFFFFGISDMHTNTGRVTVFFRRRGNEEEHPRETTDAAGKVWQRLHYSTSLAGAPSGLRVSV